MSYDFGSTGRDHRRTGDVPASRPAQGPFSSGGSAERPGSRAARASWVTAWAAWGCMAIGVALYFALQSTVATTVHIDCSFLCVPHDEHYYPAWADALWTVILLDLTPILFAGAFIAALAAAIRRWSWDRGQPPAHVRYAFGHTLSVVARIAATGSFAWLVVIVSITQCAVPLSGPNDQLWGWPWAAWGLPSR